MPSNGGLDAVESVLGVPTRAECPRQSAGKSDGKSDGVVWVLEDALDTKKRAGQDYNSVLVEPESGNTMF